MKTNLYEGRMSMVTIENKQILIDGKPTIIMCGEIHYYRLKFDEWKDRIEKLKAAGCNAVASYVPWICHEEREGDIDLDGHSRKELNLGAFIDMCRDSGLYFFVRPGPFIMAEMKNEGIPYWVFEKHPHIVPISWDGSKATAKTVDYLSPEFLEESRKWYSAVMSVIAPRLYGKGGNIIGVQLDNEIGMLSWVQNKPVLNDNVIKDFAAWLQGKYDPSSLRERYPFDIGDPSLLAEKVRTPEDTYAAELLHDLGYFMRNRFARYVATLRAYAEEFGVKEVPFVINIHGTGGGRALMYPIGISQLYEAYTQDKGYISGSDIYLGDLTMNNFQDLYIINGFMDAVANEDQPLTSIEFECGDGNYGCTLSPRYDVSAADFKTRMCIAQGNRMLNYYLFAGGRNYVLNHKPHDGNDRIAITGERHGFAAPVSPEGELNYTYPRMSRTIKTILAAGEKVASMQEEHDDVAFAFIPDYYMTEYCYKKSGRMKEIVENLEARRAGGAWEIMGRAMLLAGYRFGSIDIQNKWPDANTTPVIALPSARYMDSSIQKKLVDYMSSGGGLLIYGELPQYDMEGKPCSLLAEALGVEVSGERYDGQGFYLSIYADGWANPRPEIRSHYAQVFKSDKVDAILRVRGTDEICGFDMAVGRGRAIVIACSYLCDINLFKAALEKLGAKVSLTHDCSYHGIFMTSASNREKERFIHILNLDGFEKEFHIFEKGCKLFGGRKLHLQPRDALMLPLNVEFGGIKVRYSTAEVLGVAESSIEFRLTQPEDIIVFEKSSKIKPSDDYTIHEEGDDMILLSRKHSKIDDHLVVAFDKV
ncbi:beta-galactosidase [Clostridium thermosuccinogenes]|uniref:beta-galactosidase n=1 Tax=Clostridium thermosuccinogenes TaxID=84032 RepID=UPI001930F88A|nr:beta-galactosidase [Pseudoclostridium thermosuccinogenes]